MKKKHAICSGIVAGLLLLAPFEAQAQSMSPMRGEVKSFTDNFAIRVFPANPYNHRIRIEVNVYDQDFRPVRAQVSPAQFTLGAKFSRPVNVIVPFDGQESRRVRVCTESIPFPGKSVQQIKAMVCGKFLAKRLQ